jgi:cyclase
MVMTIRLAVLASLSLLASPLRAQAAPSFGSPMDSMSTVKLADGVWAFIAPDSRNSLVNGNMLLVVGRDAALLLDAGHFPSLTRRMMQEVRRLTDRPVRWLVNTHWHEDHLLGNPEVVAAYPGVTLVSSKATRNEMLSRVPRMLDEERAQYPDVIARMRQMLATRKRPDGTEIPAAGLAYLEDEATAYERFLPELAAAVSLAPTVGFERELILELGGREVRLLQPGKGNTEGDVALFVPDARVLALGDLLVAPTPFAFGSFIGEWPATLDSLLALDPAVIVPGHGPVMRDREYAAQFRALLVSITTQVEAAFRDGVVTLPEVRARVDVRELRTWFTRGDPTRERHFNNFLWLPATERAFAEAQAARRD